MGRSRITLTLHPAYELMCPLLRLRPALAKSLDDRPDHAARTRLMDDIEVIRHLSAAVPWPYPEGDVRRRQLSCSRYEAGAGAGVPKSSIFRQLCSSRRTPAARSSRFQAAASGSSIQCRDPGVVSISPVSSSVLRPESTIGQPP